MKTSTVLVATPPSVWAPAFKWLEKWTLDTTQSVHGSTVRCKLCELFIPFNPTAREAHLHTHVEELWAFTGKTITGADFFDVPDAELRQLLYDTLMKTHDALDDRLVHLKGLERSRELKLVANELIGEMKNAHVKIGEHEFDAPMCAGCIAEIAA
jgi:hypothetical protein